MKKIISLLLVLVMTVSVLGCAAISSGAQSSFAITPAVKEALYAHAYTGDSAESEAWVKWYEKDGNMYFFMPTATDENSIEIFNNFKSFIIFFF